MISSFGFGHFWVSHDCKIEWRHKFVKLTVSKHVCTLCAAHWTVNFAEVRNRFGLDCAGYWNVTMQRAGSCFIWNNKTPFASPTDARILTSWFSILTRERASFLSRPVRLLLIAGPSRFTLTAGRGRRARWPSASPKSISVDRKNWLRNRNRCRYWKSVIIKRLKGDLLKNDRHRFKLRQMCFLM